MSKRALVSVVDDDESVRESLPDLLREFGYAARVFSSAEEFLSSDCVGQTRCLILDIAMPGMTGPDLQRELVNRITRFQSSSSPLTEMRPSVHDYSNRVPWLVCSSHSAILLCSRRSTTHFKPDDYAVGRYKITRLLPVPLRRKFDWLRSAGLYWFEFGGMPE